MAGEDARKELAGRILEMARAAFGLPADERAAAGAAEMADMLAEISALSFEDDEEPLWRSAPGAERA